MRRFQARSAAESTARGAAKGRTGLMRAAIAFVLVCLLSVAVGAAFVWTPVTAMLADRMAHQATLLLDGTVLVTGGYQNGGGFSVDAVVKVARIYTPTSATTGTWASTVGAEVVGRYNHGAVRLASGKVLIFGGDSYSAAGAPAGFTATAELYDPGTGTFASTGAMNVVRENPGHALLPNGKVLVVGGQNGAGLYVKTAEIYDPGTGTWTLTASSMTF